MTFSELIQKKVKEKHSKAVLTVTPCWEEMPPAVKENYKSIGAGLFAFNKALIDATEKKAAGVLLNINAFEAYGLSGIICLKSTIDYAKTKGLIVLANTEKSGICGTVRSAVRAWIAPVDGTLPEDSPLREGAFDCDAMSFTSPVSESVAKQLATEAERSGAGILIRHDPLYESSAFSAVKTVGDDVCGLLIEGSCRTIIDLVKGRDTLLTLACPTGFETPEELQEVGSLCRLVAAPKEAQTPKAFIKFAEVI